MKFSRIFRLDRCTKFLLPILASLILTLGVTCMSGCKSNTAPTPPLAPGYTNSVDQSMGETLAAARAFYMRLQQDATAGTYKPSPAEQQALSDLGTSINFAEPLYLAFHNGTGTQQAAQTAVSAVTQKQAAVQAQISPGGK